MIQNAILTVGTAAQYESAAHTLETLGKRLPGAALFFCVVDGALGKTEEKALPAGAVVLEGERLIGKEWRDQGFFFDTEDFCTRCGLLAARELLAQGYFVYWARPGVTVQGPLPAAQNDALVAAPARGVETGNLSPDFLQSEWSTVRGEITVLGGGDRLAAFLTWCCDKMTRIFNRGYGKKQPWEPENEDTVQRAFTGRWREYAPVFGCKLIPSSMMAYALGKEPAKAESAAVQPPKSRFDAFQDGTPIPPVLRDYYGRNYRLRENCKGDPFSRRALFTDENAITGDEDPLLLPAIVEALYRRRVDLWHAIPYHTGQNREALLRWYLEYGAREQQMPESALGAIRASLEAARQKNLRAAQENAKLSRRVENRLRRLAGKPPLTAAVQTETPAELPFGVNLCGFIKGNFGLGESARILARILEAAAVPYTIVDFQGAREHTYTNEEFADRITNTFPYRFNVLDTNGDGQMVFFEDVSRDVLKNRYNIGYWAWELPEFPAENWAQSFSQLDEVWTCSDFTSAAIRSGSPVPVVTIPHAIRTRAAEGMSRKDFGLPEDRFLFLMMYDARSYTARKNPEAAVEAFCRAFPEQEEHAASLVIKVNAPKGWNGRDKLLDRIRGRRDIILLVQFFPKEALNALICACDAFVSLHRSEGFGLGPAEAMFFGKPAVLTNWSGNTQYMREDNCCPVPYEIVEIDEDHGPYKKGCHWAEPDVDEAARLMRRLAEDRGYYETIAQKGRETILEEFSPEAVGKRLRARLEEIQADQEKHEETAHENRDQAAL